MTKPIGSDMNAAPNLRRALRASDLEISETVTDGALRMAALARGGR